MQSENKNIVNNIIQLLNPERDSLLKVISKEMNGEMLVNIANADYGYKAEKNLIALQAIKATYQIPTNDILAYEVLGLIRHIAPTEETNSANYNCHTDHIQRAFCCTILITANTLEDENYSDMSLDNEEYNLIQLIESINYLGKDFQLAAIPFLAWKINTQGFFYEDEVTDPLSLFTLIYFLAKTTYPISETDLKILLEHLSTVKGNEYYNWWEFDTFLKSNLKWIKVGKELPDLTHHLKNNDLKNKFQKISDLITINNQLLF